MKNNKKDYLVAVIAAVATALLLLPTLSNTRLGAGIIRFSFIIIIPILWIIGLWLGKILSRFVSFAYQFAKFVVVGFLNTSIDFGVLNLLSMLSGLTGGFLIGGVNVPGFILAAINSYFWNKFWVFAKKREAEEKVDYSDFFTFSLVVIIGAIINGGIIVLLTTYVHPWGGLSPARWLNIAKVCATAVSLIWNFVGFKVLVFKSKAERTTK